MTKNKPISFDIVTIFPQIFSSYFSESLIKKAIGNGLVKINVHDLREFSTERHQKVDDRPFGGGPGMVLMVEPILRAIKKIVPKKNKGSLTILFSPRGKVFNSNMAKRFAAYKNIVLVCGRYEGVDERVATHIVDEVVSLGDFVLSGGEIPAMALIESTLRFVPGFLGKSESLEEINGSFPTFSRPEKVKLSKSKTISVPKVLLSGNHKEIEKWRRLQKQS